MQEQLLSGPEITAAEAAACTTIETMPSIESYQMLLAAAAACEDKKAEDVRILALDPAESGLADYFLICNGTNDRQNVAITDEIEIRMKRDFGTYPNSVEGRRQGEWILMDYVDFIVHVFSPEKRAYYGLERLRKSATTMSIDDLNSELKASITATRKKTPVPAKPGEPKPAKKVAALKRTNAAKPAAATKRVALQRPAAKKAAGAKKSTASTKSTKPLGTKTSRIK